MPGFFIFKFGKGEKLTCLTDVSVKGPEDETLCLAHKTSTYWAVAGVYVRDEGHVLQVRGRDFYYPLPDEPQLSELQAAGALPRPLTPYSIPLVDYLFGYSLWIVILTLALYHGVKALLVHRRIAEDANVPVTTGPPLLRTDTDRFIAEELAKIQTFGETAQHQALVQDNHPDLPRVFYAVLTDRRLVLIKTRFSTFAPIHENESLEAIARDDIAGAAREGDVITLHLRDGTARELRVPSSERYLSNQRSFLRDVPRLLAAEPSAAAA